MPKYNLMDNLESEENDSPKPSEKNEKKAPDEELDESKLSDFIVEDIVISEPEMEKEQSDDADSPESPRVPEPEPADDFTGQEKFTVPEGTPPMQPFDLGSDYADEKQPGMNYKPFLIGLAAVAAIIIIYFSIDYFFLSNDQTADSEMVVETPEEKAQREREERRQAFFSNLNTKNQHRLSYISSLSNLSTDDVKFSSLLLYENSFNFEIFATNREKLARFNMNLKNSGKFSNFSIETAENRPGSRGGVFALYNLNLTSAPAGTGATAEKAVATTPANWIAGSTNQFSLSVHSQRQISNRTENQFSVTRHEIILTGAEGNCMNLIKNIASQKSNIFTHKLNLLPSNQRDMSKSAYELRLVLDFYM